MPTRRRTTIKSILGWATIVLWVSPLLLLARLAVLPAQDLIAPQPNLLSAPTAEHFVSVAKHPALGRAFGNSLLISTSAMLLGIVCAAPAAYVLAAASDRVGGFGGWVLCSRMVPPAVVLLPLFFLFQQLHLINHPAGLIVVLAAMNLPLSVWILRGAFRDVPRSRREAVRADGGTSFDEAIVVALPYIAPRLGVAAVFQFVFAWNEYLFSSVLCTQSDARTISALTTDFITGYQIFYGTLFAAGVVMLIPGAIAAAATYYLIRSLGATFGKDG